MQRRKFSLAASALAASPAIARPALARPAPGQQGWPSHDEWAGLETRVGGALLRPVSPFDGCSGAPGCQEALAQLRNPFFLGDHPALTQTSGWAGAWTSRPSAYAVAARNSGDVAAAVDFARTHGLRLVVKGGGHSYKGTSNAANSLLIWTRRMRDVTLHEAFLPQGSAGQAVPAVSLGAGALWLHAYEAVTTGAGRYVQGGGCTTVGVAGLVQGGGFGSFSKRFGTAASGLLEAEVVTADGRIRTVNADRDPDLFWALKGGGAGFGVVTRLTLRTHALPGTFGGVFGTLRARDEAGFRNLIARFMTFYRDALHNPHWGESVRFRPDNSLVFGMVFQDLSQAEAEQVWQPFLAGADAEIEAPIRVLALPARRMWDAAWLRQAVPGLTLPDSRPGAAPGHFFWAGDQGQVGQYLHGYGSAWLPSALLREAGMVSLQQAILEASRHATVALHFNKGLSGAPQEALAAFRGTATHPAAADAFALAISGVEGSPAFPGQPGPEPDLARARLNAARVAAAIARLRRIVPGAAAYVWESDYFERDWQITYWGSNYRRLLEVKRRYDPDGLFTHHHAVGSENA
ncbi:FAD-dependent oxidoreductase [Roseococcus sp. YIM B11640]|uniref:FAD-dependent oxidoreductase n=1 Tax=Roseococcus sp. YIM B11640 TaxID=3133973 RepID=UPI003C7ED4CC